MKPHKAILSLRCAVQAFLGTYEEQCSSLVVSDLRHDESAINGYRPVDGVISPGSPRDSAFVWVISTGGTHMVRCDGVVQDNGPGRADIDSGARYLRAVGEAYRGAPMWFRYWDGSTMHAVETLGALIERYESHARIQGAA